jgi:hypothetical protein
MKKKCGSQVNRLRKNGAGDAAARARAISLPALIMYMWHSIATGAVLSSNSTSSFDGNRE